MHLSLSNDYFVVGGNSCFCSEVLPAVLKFEMCVDVLEWSFVLVSVLVDIDLGPLGGVFHIWEGGAKVLFVLNSHGGAIVPPWNLGHGEGWVSVAFDSSGEIAEGK